MLDIKWAERKKRHFSLPLEYCMEVLDRLLPGGQDPISLTPQEKAPVNFAQTILKQQTTEEEFCNYPFSLYFRSHFNEKEEC